MSWRGKRWDFLHLPALTFMAKFFIALTCLSAVAGAAQLHWDGAASAGDPGGGAGTWNTTTVNWDTALTGGAGVAWTSNDAVFSGTAGLVTMGASITASSLNFSTSGYSFALGARVLTVNGGVFSSFAGNVFSVTGTSGSLLIGGAGNLTAAQAVTLSSGILTLQYAGVSHPLGEAELVLGGGTLNLRRDGANDATLEELLLLNRIRLTGSGTINADRLGASGGSGKVLRLAGLTIGAQTLTTASANGFIVGFDTVSLTGAANFTTNAETWIDVVSGAAAITKAGTATLVFRNASSWAGGLNVTGGTVEAQVSGALGAGVVTFSGTSNSALTVSRSASLSNGIVVGGTGGTRALNVRGGKVTLAGNVAMNRATTVDVAEGSLATLSGTLSGTTALTKTGRGTLVLTRTDNTFGTGAAASIVVTGGKLSVDDDLQLGNPGNGVRLSGGGLVISEAIESDRNLNLVGTANVVEVAELVEFGLATSAITGTGGGYTKRGKGTLRLDVAATATGGVTLGDGELRTTIGTGSPFGTSAALRLNYGMLSLTPLSETLAISTLSAGVVTFGGATRVMIDGSGLTPGAADTVLATFSTGALTRVDRGTLVISALSGIDFLGAPANEGERWRASSTAVTPFYSPYVVAIDSDPDETPHFVRYTTSNGFLSAASNYTDGFDPNPLIMEIADIDVETLAADESVLAARIGGVLDIDPGVTLSVGGTSATAGIIFHGAGAITGGQLSFGAKEMIVFVGKAASAVIETDIITSGAAGGFTKFGPGSLELVVQNGNSNLGEISVHEGTLGVDDLGALGAGNELLRIGVAEFTYGGSANATLGRPVVIGPSGGAVIRATSATLALDRVVSGGAPGLALTITGGDSVRLENSGNTFAGDILVDGATLLIAGPGSVDPTVLGAGQKDIRLTNSGRFEIESGDLDPLADTKRWIVDGDGEFRVASGVLRFNNPNQLAGLLNGNLKISGGGMVEIGDGQDDFLSRIDVDSGTLIVSGSISGSVSVGTTATLRGTGSVGPVDVRDGGTLSPDGMFEAAGLALSSGGNARFDLDSASGYDQVSVVGAISLSGSLTLDLGFTPVIGVDVFFLMLNDHAEAITGAFAGLSQGAAFNSGGELFQISYTAESGVGFAGVGNDVAVRSIPEPTSVAFLLMGLAFAIPRRQVR